MRKVIKLIAYAAAFTFVMPQVVLASLHGELRLTFLWYVLFILVIESVASVFDLLVDQNSLNRMQQLDAKKIKLLK